jgi:hypothetical protein
MKYARFDKLVVTKEFGFLVTDHRYMRFEEGRGMSILDPKPSEGMYLVSSQDVVFYIDKETLECVTEMDGLYKKQYNKVIESGLTYSQAMEKLLDEGKLVTRKVWDGYWTVQTLGNLTGEPAWHGRFIVAKLKNGGFAVASPYQEDMFARDWMVVEVQ